MSFLVGYDEGRLLDSKDQERTKIQERKIRAHKWELAFNGKNVIQLYKVTGSNEWYLLSDLAPRSSYTV